MTNLTPKEKRIITWVRIVVVALIFGAIYATAPKFIVGAFFGYMFMLLAIKCEEDL